MPEVMEFLLIGSGQQLIASADLLLARGHQVRGVVSDCPEVSSWAQKKGIARLAPTNADVQARWLAERRGDYLLSIVNHAITPAEVLAVPTRGAINYHDSPLPAYAGFNATAWSIIDGKRSHAVTWHEMTADVDGGRILLQRAFDIADDDTAFTLAAKCSEEGVSSFAALLDRLEAGDTGAAGVIGGSAKSFHFRSDRPDVAVLDFRKPANVLHALIRGLNFGPDENWMTKPKLALPGGFVAFTEARLDPTRQSAPGTVLAVGDRSLEVAADGGVLQISEVAALDGTPVSEAQLRGRYGVSEGTALSALADDERDALRAFDAAVTKSERFWVKRLAKLHAPSLPGLALAASGAGSRLEVLTRTLPEALAGATPSVRQRTVVAAFAAYLARVGEGGTFDLALHRPLTGALSALYASAAPLSLSVDSAQTFSALCEAIGAELDQQDKRRTYARDVLLRYGSLRALTPDQRALPIGVRFDGAQPALTEGTLLTLAVPAEESSYALVYDPAALSTDAARTLAERLDVLLAAALRDGATSVAALPLLPQAERTLLEQTWQDTARPYAHDRCVHTLFEEQVARTPDATALVFRDRTLSYRALNERANQLAHTLRALGVGPDTLVGISVERSLEMVIGLLGILKAGGAYVPLDPVYPRDRLAMMLEDAKAKVLVTQRHLADRLPTHGAQIVCVDELEGGSIVEVDSGVKPAHLAYVIFTSGSTGRPKGVMVEHRNVSNFFTGMDESLGATPGVWLAVTSISFDISVLELFWTLTRGFEVVVQEESDKSSLARERTGGVAASSKPMGFGLFYFAAESGANQGDAYRLLIEGAKFADTHDFGAVWTPERHFHAFGGLYPNPAVTTAALATITQNVHLRAGSVVLPLHHPLRVAEDWAVIDHLSKGRVGLSFASGWHVNDFAFYPENYEKRREVMLESIEAVRKLWRGEKLSVKNGAGQTIEVSALPRPLQANPPLWIASAGSVDTFKLAGRIGANVLTNMLGQDLADLTTKFAAYREARKEHGHAGDGIVSVMLHTFVCDDDERAKSLARKPFSNYLASSFDLVKVAPWMFPAFRQPSRASAQDPSFDPSSFNDEDMAALLDHAFDRYFDTAGLFGTPERALKMVEQLKDIGASEVACLIDFGIAPDVVLESLPHLNRLRQISNPKVSAQVSPAQTAEVLEPISIGTQLAQRGVTHLQCTPSMARMLLSDPEARAQLGQLKKLMLGGEALPTELVDELGQLIKGEIVNMYGPTETTIWSTTSKVNPGEPITIGRPIANTTIRILDAGRALAPIGVAGELCIGGSGVVRGYLERPDLTAERFVDDPVTQGARIYRTGDLARYRADGAIEFLGRLDHQVKVNGYRIELGEIETVLGRHPAVKQAVVVARTDEGPARLVGYVIPEPGAAADNDQERVGHWQSLWDETYKQAGEARAVSDPRFNIAGWNDSYTGEPIPPAAMREWLDATVQRIVDLKPQRVLEIGCGTGMILYGVLPHVAHYTGVDLSPHALETIRQELSPAERERVTLINQPAHALEGIAPRSCDLVVINSVAQYFPDQEYFAAVLKRASELVADGGHIFLGDVRSLALLTEFHTVVELHRAGADARASDIDKQIARRVAEERELLVAPGFFAVLSREVPRLTGLDVQLKRGAHDNEMSVFRYDAVLRVAGAAEAAVSLSDESPRSAASLDEVRALLTAEPAALWLTDLMNRRLAGVLAAREAIARDPDAKLPTLRALFEQGGRGIDPEALYQIDARYAVELRWASSGAPGKFDALLRHKRKGPSGRWALPEPKAGARRDAFANQPAKLAGAGDDLAGVLRAHLRESLPEFMVPAAFVTLAAFPLTPNGKIDRKALPAPHQRKAASGAEYAPPSNDLEQQITEVWQEMLNIERVGRRDNIFDLGANSLLTVQANNRLSALLGRKVSLVSMFRFPTVESLAAHLGDGGKQPPAQVQKRVQERADRRTEAAERRRQVRAERSGRGS